MLVGLALSSLILSGCSSGPNVDTTQWRPYRLATSHTVEPIGLITLRPRNGIWVTLERR